MQSPVFSTRSRVRMLAVAGLGLAGGFGLSKSAFAFHEASPVAESGGENAITIHAMDFTYDLPSEIASGWTRFTLVNDGTEDHHAQLIGIPEGMDFQGFLDLFAAEGEGALGQVTLAGGPGAVAPGHTSEAVVWVDPGLYAVACFISGEDGVPHFAKGMIAPLTVTPEENGVEPPAADVAVSMIDFAYQIPSEIAAGKTTFELTNNGQEPHEFAVLQLAEGVTAEMLSQMLMAPPAATPADSGEHNHSGTPAPAEALPFTSVGGLQAIAPGTKGYAVLDLVPANYTALCFVPSPGNGGAPHAMLGMIAGFTVA